MAGSETVIEIDHEEWDHVVRRLSHALGADERSVWGKYGLDISDGRRRWFASDTYRLMSYDAGPAQGSASVLVSPRVLDAWPLVSASFGSAELRINGGSIYGYPVMSIEGPGGSLTVEQDRNDPVDIDSYFLAPDPSESASFSADSADLVKLMSLASCRPPTVEPDDERESPYMWLRLDVGSLSIEIDWGELGLTRYQIPVEGGSPAVVSVNPKFFAQMIAAFEPGEVDVVLPQSSDAMVRLTQGALSGFLMPIDPSRPVTNHVETVLGEAFGEPATFADRYGNYLLDNTGTPVLGRILQGDPPRLLVYATALTGVEPTAELFVELNQLNATTGIAKLRWESDRVFVEGELVASMVEPGGVSALSEQIASLADGLAATLATKHGGAPSIPGRQARWTSSVHALISAELVPGEWLCINGPDATHAFPFVDPVFVLSSDSPHGIGRPVEIDERDRARLAAELTRFGAGFVRARWGRSDGDASTAGFLVWNLDQSSVESIASLYGQEAFFRITHGEIAVVGIGQTGEHVQERTSSADYR